jgi:hypothetical protein
VALLNALVSPSAVLLVALAAAAPSLDVTATAVDPAATTAGLRARTGAALDGWQVTVRDGAAADEVDAVLVAPDGRREQRRLVLTGATVDERSRELAASLALVVEDHDPIAPAARPEPGAPAPAAKLRGWLGIGPRLEVGLPPAGGLDLAGGAWLLRDHLQPLAVLAWTSTASQGLRMHTLRLGGGLAAGAPLAAGKIWLGGHVLLHAQWVRARDARVASAWTAATELGATVQARWSRLVVGGRTGVDLNFPPLALQGDAARLTRGPAAWLLAVHVGFVFG